MKVVTTLSGNVRIELQAETTDDKHIVQIIKDKQVHKISVSDNGVVFEMAAKG